MQLITDLHLHSRFSRAVSPQMTIPNLAQWGLKKGIGLIATGDWTHPLWMKEIQRDLEEMGNGLLKLKDVGALAANKNLDAFSVASAISPSTQSLRANETAQNFVRTPRQIPLFLLSTEISCIFSQAGKGRRVHTLVWVPSIASAIKIGQEITKRGGNVLSDGRPILGFSLIQLSELVLSIEPHALIIPAHAWTPWFSVMGSMGGFTSLKEAFGPYEKYIYAIETGLSSSPDMNWRISEFDTRSIVSFSDAHSGPKLGREATVFELPEVSYDNIEKALKNYTNDPKKPHIAHTIEFYPEEGKYHYTGHRACNIRLTPEEVVAKGANCPVCGKPLTQGVMQRVEQIATKTLKPNVTTEKGVSYYSDKLRKRPPFMMVVPLQEIISEAIGSPVASPKVAIHYDNLITKFGGEFDILLHVNLSEIASCSTPQIADGVRKVRSGDIVIDPGYDGVFGVVKIWKSDKDKALVSSAGEQIGIF
jgi:uncharacterized protein (TIGR00375 family)